MTAGRKETRWNLVLFLPVHDLESGEFLGYIADIAEHGILLFSSEHIEMGKEYHMRVRLDDIKEALVDKDIDSDIDFSARSRWVDLDVKPAFHRTGFMFKDLDDNTERKVRFLIRNVASNLV